MNKKKKTNELSLTPRFNSRKMICMIFAAIFMMSILTVTCFATGTTGTTDMWTKASDIMKDVYNKVVGISTISAVVTAAIALLLMNFSKNGKTVDESRAWLEERTHRNLVRRKRTASLPVRRVLFIIEMR